MQYNISGVESNGNLRVGEKNKSGDNGGNKGTAKSVLQGP